MSRVTLEIQGLSVSYHRGTTLREVVHDVSIGLRSGQILGLAGESGCGKSTTALAGIGYRAAGAVVSGSSRLGGTDELIGAPLTKLRTLWGQRVGYLPQDATTALNPALPVGAQLEQVLRAHTSLRGSALQARMNALLEQVQMAAGNQALTRYPFQHSGGQQQRLALALALSCSPTVLILDEPTSGLDVTTRARIVELLRSLVSELGIAVLFVSHDLALLSVLADRIAVMYGGQIVEEGGAREVCNRPAHPYTKALIEAVPSAKQRLRLGGIAGLPPSEVHLSGCAFAPRCQYRVAECTSSAVPLVAAAERSVRCIRQDIFDRAPAVRSAPEIGSKAPGEAPLLQVSELDCRYGSGQLVIQGVSFKVAKRQTLGVVGESGSGKSTLLRAIAGLHKPAGGLISFDGQKLPATARKRSRDTCGAIQLVFQNPDASLNPRHTIRSLVLRSVQLFRPDLPRRQQEHVLGELLESVKLPLSIASARPAELSGGQRQRVALARAFAAQPRLLLCDEVTSALDVSVQASIIEIIRELAEVRNVAVIFVSHDVGVVRSIAEEVVVMERGRVRESGSIEKVFDHPTDSYTRALLAAVPELVELNQ
jgi:peptide/nickel transport system ATP-binding protein